MSKSRFEQLIDLASQEHNKTFSYLSETFDLIWNILQKMAQFLDCQAGKDIYILDRSLEPVSRQNIQNAIKVKKDNNSLCFDFKIKIPLRDEFFFDNNSNGDESFVKELILDPASIIIPITIKKVGNNHNIISSYIKYNDNTQKEEVISNDEFKINQDLDNQEWNDFLDLTFKLLQKICGQNLQSRINKPRQEADLSKFIDYQ